MGLPNRESQRVAVMEGSDALMAGLWLFCSIHTSPALVTLGHSATLSFLSRGSSASIARPKSEMGTPVRSRARRLGISLMYASPAFPMPTQQEMLSTCETHKPVY